MSSHRAGNRQRNIPACIYMRWNDLLAPAPRPSFKRLSTQSQGWRLGFQYARAKLKKSQLCFRRLNRSQYDVSNLVTFQSYLPRLSMISRLLPGWLKALRSQGCSRLFRHKGPRDNAPPIEGLPAGNIADQCSTLERICKARLTY